MQRRINAAGCLTPGNVRRAPSGCLVATVVAVRRVRWLRCGRVKNGHSPDAPTRKRPTAVEGCRVGTQAMFYVRGPRIPQLFANRVHTSGFGRDNELDRRCAASAWRRCFIRSARFSASCLICSSVYSTCCGFGLPNTFSPGRLFNLMNDIGFPQRVGVVCKNVSSDSTSGVGGN